MSKSNRGFFFKVRPCGRRGFQVVSCDYGVGKGVFVAEMAYKASADKMCSRLDEHVIDLCYMSFAAGQEVAMISHLANSLRDLKKMYGDTKSAGEILSEADPEGGGK